MKRIHSHLLSAFAVASLAACSSVPLDSTPVESRTGSAVVSGTGQPIVDQGAAARRALAHYASLRTCAGLSASPPAGATPTSAG